MTGISAISGKIISDVEHLEQSIRDILSTPIGTRVMRRDYGSRLMELLDRPMGAELVAEIQTAVAMALTSQEPRIRLTRVNVELPGNDPTQAYEQVSQGNISIHLEGYFLPEGRQIVLRNILQT